MSTTATRQEIEQRVYKALEEFGAEPDQITGDAEFESLDVDSLDLVELGGVPRVDVVERHEHPVAGRFDDRGDRALPAEDVFTGKGEPPALQPTGADHRGMRTVGTHPGRVEVRAVRGVLMHGDDDSRSSGWGSSSVNGRARSSGAVSRECLSHDAQGARRRPAPARATPRA